MSEHVHDWRRLMTRFWRCEQCGVIDERSDPDKDLAAAASAIVDAADKARTAWGPGVMLRDIHDEMFDLVLAVDAWRKLKGKG